MNCRSKQTLFSFLPRGALLSGKSQFSFRRNRNPKLIHEVVTPNQTPDKRNPVVPPKFGQPTYLTHPHRIKKGEVGDNFRRQIKYQTIFIYPCFFNKIVPGITVEEFQQRRGRLLDMIKAYCSHHDVSNKSLFIIIPSSCKKYMTEKIPYVFRQNSDFLYLTGCLEQDSVLVLTVKENKDESIIFVRGRDLHSELWDGPRTGVEQAADLFGVDKSIPMRDFPKFLESFVKDNQDCLLWYDYLNDVQPKVHTIVQQFITDHSQKVWESPKRLIHQLRLIKSVAEQELMKKSGEIGSLAIKKTMAESRPWDTEAFIHARVDFHCRMNGAEYLAYPPVVAAGERANIIHYINNDHVAEDGDLVLMDAGCEYHGYCSDISRTWPISGRFSQAQRALYEAVLSVQTDLIQMCCQFPTLDELYYLMVKLLGLRLKEAGVFLNQTDDVDKQVQMFCPHHVSHYLGMDVHDTSSVVRHIPLKPGMVCTIEPGVYISKTNDLANPDYRGLGIRIEDDILMTSSGPLVLSASCPKHPDDIENLRSS